MTNDEVQDLCDLNEEQLKTFKKLERAYQNCLKQNIYFHQVLDKIYPFNGNNVKEIDDTDTLGTGCNSAFCTQFIFTKSMKITDPWADDNHFVHLK